MLILGVTHPISWNSAACLLRDGILVAFAEEERFTRWKHSARLAPVNAIAYCLREARASLDQVDLLAIGWEDGDKHKRSRRWPWNYLVSQLPFSRHDRRVRYVRHHRAHAASAFDASGFDRANILSLDGYGGSESGLLAVGEGDQIREVRAVPPKESWGHIYGEVTAALGFRFHSEESKVMALAALGTPDPDRFSFLDWDEEIPAVKPDALREFLQNLPRRARGAEITNEVKDVAATLQQVLERAALRMAEFLHKQTGYRKICLAGGCALNCAMNGVLAKAPFVDEIFVQPAAHDAGAALGAAFEAWREAKGTRVPAPPPHPFFGPRFSNEEVEAACREAGIRKWRRSPDAPAEAAARVAGGQVVAWFRGRMEFGPRALGGRSILADARDPAMRERLNRDVKGREPWSPFGPALLEEEAARTLALPRPARTMTVAVEATPEARQSLPSAVHVDGTTRPQTVPAGPEGAPLRPFLESFREKTGVGAVLNTSFNLPGEPIVCSPRDAIGTFFAGGCDALVMEDVVVEK